MSFTVAEEIQEILAAFSHQSLPLDHFLGLETANVQQDLRAMLAVASLPGLQMLQDAFQNRRVVSCRYFDGDGDGCLVFHLFGICNNEQLIELDLPSVETGFALYRTIQAWDSGRLSHEVAEHFVQQEIASRESSIQQPQQESMECQPA